MGRLIRKIERIEAAVRPEAERFTICVCPLDGPCPRLDATLHIRFRVVEREPWVSSDDEP